MCVKVTQLATFTACSAALQERREDLQQGCMYKTSYPDTIRLWSAMSQQCCNTQQFHEREQHSYTCDFKSVCCVSMRANPVEHAYICRGKVCFGETYRCRQKECVRFGADDSVHGEQK